MDRQRAFIERLGMGVLALDLVHRREFVQVLGYINMIWTADLLSNLQRANVERFSLFKHRR
jgi:hypothetical protein